MTARTGAEAEPTVDASLAEAHGINAEEYERLLKMMGRTPTYTELGITSALWSEHCSYKSSKVYLSQFPTEGPRVIHGPGENAGVVDIGHGWVAAFKMESHNHPSYIEPYQGAATGVGGILRDVFTMGARPIACMDALRFGEIDAPRMKYLVDGVVRGIGDYGNCVGIPTVGGETSFHKSYNGNILVNAFALGVARHDEIFTAVAAGVGNPVLYVGSRTGRDGIHGATMASESFDSESESKRPTVQVGDPFTEKILLEACIEAMATGAIVGIQDMGAAGLTSSAFEMAGRSGTGIDLRLDDIPLREKDLSAYEMMLSESQERMVIVAERGREEEIVRVFEAWDLSVQSVGHVTDTAHAVIRHHGEVVADMPIEPLTDEAPMYRRPIAPPADLVRRQEAPSLPELNDPMSTLSDLLGTPDLCSKEWIWRQYDHTVRTNTIAGPGGDAAVLRLKGTPSALAVTSDVNPVYCSLDPRRGGMQAVTEAMRNLACVGAEPVGLTDCLNFGNPENPEISWQFSECVAGMSEACRAYGIPVVSGNVSFYNETEGSSIFPTPTVAMVGLIETLQSPVGISFQTAGDRLLLLGETRDEFGGAAMLRLLYDTEQGRPPEVDLAAEARLSALLRELAGNGSVHSIHDLSEGGLAIALAEGCFERSLGARVDLQDLSPLQLFSESQARAIVSVDPQYVEVALKRAEALGVPARDIGEVGGDDLSVTSSGGSSTRSVEALHDVWKNALPRMLG